MTNNTNKSSSKDMKLFREQIEKALKEAALEARKIAKETNPPLVIYDKDKGIQEIMIVD